MLSKTEISQVDITWEPLPVNLTDEWTIWLRSSRAGGIERVMSYDDYQHFHLPTNYRILMVGYNMSAKLLVIVNQTTGNKIQQVMQRLRKFLD